MTQPEWITIIVGVVMAIGGFLLTSIIGVIAFLIRRLIGTVDQIKKTTEKFAIELAQLKGKHPTFPESEHLSQRISDNRVILHERNEHQKTD